MPGYANRSRPTSRKMTRVHYEMIAETLKASRPDAKELGQGATYGGAILQYHNMVDAFTSMCRGTNPRFDSSRFYRACGLEE